jgi:hypothetical protein
MKQANIYQIKNEHGVTQRIITKITRNTMRFNTIVKQETLRSKFIRFVLETMFIICGLLILEFMLRGMVDMDNIDNVSSTTLLYYFIFYITGFIFIMLLSGSFSKTIHLPQETYNIPMEDWMFDFPKDSNCHQLREKLRNSRR